MQFYLPGDEDAWAAWEVDENGKETKMDTKTQKKERIRDFFTVGTSRCKMVDEVIRCTYNEFRKCIFFLKNNFYYMKKS